MADQKIIDQAERVLYKTYNRYPVVFDHGKGVTLYDSEGNAYLDFGAGIAVMGLGYGDEAFNQAVKAQVDQLTHISNLFYKDVYKRQEKGRSMPCCLQYSISSSRDFKVHTSVIRQGAMIFKSGARALIASSKRIWSLPLPVAP